MKRYSAEVLSCCTELGSDQEQFWNNTQITQNKLKVAQPMPTARLVEVELPEWRKDSHLCRMGRPFTRKGATSSVPLRPQQET